MRVIIYLAIKAVLIPLTKILFRTRVRDRENLPKKGPFIIASNHTSFADVPLITLSIPYRIRWIAHSDVYNIAFLRPFHDLFGTIVVNGSVAKALKCLKEGGVLGIFPEGTRSTDGRLKKGDAGVAILALRSGAPVVPVGISGLFESFGRHRRFPKFHPVLVKIGPPIAFPAKEFDALEKLALINTTDLIMNKINQLLLDI